MAAGAAIERLVDPFIDALWIEDRLAPLTLAAYRREAVLDPDGVDEAVDRIAVATIRRRLRRAHSSVSFCSATTFL